MRCDGRDQAVATVVATDPATTSSARSATASSGQRWRAAQHAGGRIRTGDPSVKPPAPATAPKTGRAPPPQRLQRPVDLSINLHDGFCHFLSIVVGFVKMGKPRSPACENETEKRAQEGRDLKICQPQRALF